MTAESLVRWILLVLGTFVAVVSFAELAIGDVGALYALGGVIAGAFTASEAIAMFSRGRA